MKDFREAIQSGHGTALVCDLEPLPRHPHPYPSAPTRSQRYSLLHREGQTEGQPLTLVTVK